MNRMCMKTWVGVMTYCLCSGARLNRPQKKELEVPGDAYVQGSNMWPAAIEMHVFSVIRIDWMVSIPNRVPIILI